VDSDFVLAPRTVTVSIDVEPAFNLLSSLHLLEGLEDQSGFSAWVENTAANMTPEQLRFNQLMFRGHYFAILPDTSWKSFPTYIDHLAAQDSQEFGDRALWMYRQPPDDIPVPPREALLGDLDTFLGFFERLTAQKVKKYPDKAIAFDRDLHAEMFELYQHPASTKRAIVSHLQIMWETYLEPEWRRVLPLLQEAVDAFQQIDYSGMTAHEAIRSITGRDLSGVWDNWAERIIFIPSLHIGPYVARIEGPSVDRLVFGARLPEGSRVSSPALSRSDLLVRLNALADDTRLRILELLTRNDELCAQDIMTMLDLSQSSASRHLRQLTASGYLTERRREIAKCYGLNHDRVEDTLQALKHFMVTK
jgi:hypothetical protein